MNIPTLLAAATTVLTVGYTILRCFNASSDYPTALRVGLWWCLGCGMISQQLLWYGWLGIAWHPFAIMAPWATFFAVQCRMKPLRFLNAGKARSWIPDTFLVVLAIILALPVASMPVWNRDGWMIWNYKARFLYANGDIVLSNFRVQDFGVFTHSDYPLLLPLIQNWFMQLAGNAWDWASMAVTAIFFAMLLCILYGCSQLILKNKWLSLLSVTYYALLPTVLQNASMANADLPLACFLTAGTTLFYRWLQHESLEDYFLGSLMLGLGAWTKLEGQLSWIILHALVMGVALWQKKYKKEYFFGALASLALWLPWNIYSIWNGLRFERWLESAAMSTILERIPITAQAVFTSLSSLESWNFLWILVPASLFLFKRKQLFIPMALLALLVTYCSIYLITPMDIQFHLKTSLSRLLFQLSPLALLCLLVPFESKKHDGSV